MGETNYWLTMAKGLWAAKETGRLSKCTCGPAPSADGLCGHCRLEEAERALNMLRMHSRAQEKVLWLLRNRGQFRAKARRQLNKTFVLGVEEALDGCLGVQPTPHALRDSLRSQTLEQLTCALSAEPRWEADEWLDDGMVAMLKETDLEGECGPWAVDDGPWTTGEADDAEEGPWAEPLTTPEGQEANGRTHL